MVAVQPYVLDPGNVASNKTRAKLQKHNMVDFNKTKWHTNKTKYYIILISNTNGTS